MWRPFSDVTICVGAAGAWPLFILTKVCVRRAGAGLGQTLGFVWSAAGHQHPGQHGVQQEAGAAQRLRGETEPRPRPQTAGPQGQDKGTTPTQNAMRPNGCHVTVTNGLKRPVQTQSTLLQMTGTKAASKKERSEPPADQPDVPPDVPTSPVHDAENKR